MAITTMDGLVAAFPGQRYGFLKSTQTAEGAGTWHSFFLATGQPGAGSTPATGSGAVPTSATAGAIPFTDPGGGSTTYLARFAATGSNATAFTGTLILYDRLWHNSGQVGNITTSQTVNSSSLTRPNSNGDTTELWGEVYSAMGATGSTFTATYTNQAGTGSRSATYVMPANALSVGQMFPFTLQAGDTGVRSVQSVSLTPSTGTAGNFGLVILRRVAEIFLTSTAFNQLDFAGLGMPQVYDSACLCLMQVCNGTIAGAAQGSVTLIQG